MRNLHDIFSSAKRFQVTALPNEVVFHEEAAFDHVWLEGKPILHVVDQLKGHSAEGIMAAFIKCWSSLYTG